MKFKRIYVEITNVCNLSCSFCPPVKRAKKFISEDEFLHIIKEIKPFTKYIYFHIKGEPLLHPNVLRFLDICYENDIYVNLTTNGTLIDKLGDELITKKALRQVNVSLHSFNDNKSVDKDKYLDNLLKFAKNAKKNGSPYVSFRIWTLDNLRQADDISKGMITTVCDYFGDVNNMDKLFLEKKITLEDGIFLSFEEQFIWPSLDNDYISNKGTCYGARTMLGILVDGTVVPCCLDSDGVINLGNIYDTDFSKIVNGDDVKEISSNFCNNKVVAPLCMRCGYRTRFSKNFFSLK